MSEKKSIRFNIIDVLIIFLIILSVVGIYFRSHITEWIGMDTQLDNYSITFKVTGIRASSGEHFIMGERIYLDYPDMELGVIDNNCTVNPSDTYVTLNDGTVVSVPSPESEYIDVIGNLKCQGAMRADDGFYLGGSYLITPGMTLKVHTEQLDFTITVINIEEYSV